jgi:hypothetical protein
VIPAHEKVAQPLNTLDDLIRTRAVSHNIAQIGDHIVCGRSGETRFQGLQIAVNITQDKYAQWAPGKMAIIDPWRVPRGGCF